MDDVYSNQKQLSDVVADYFFVCPTNLFANIVSSRGARVYYYFFTHVSCFSLFVHNTNNNNNHINNLLLHSYYKKKEFFDFFF